MSARMMNRAASRAPSAVWYVRMTSKTGVPSGMSSRAASGLAGIRAVARYDFEVV
jgi:hypothetical protein